MATKKSKVSLVDEVSSGQTSSTDEVSMVDEVSVVDELSLVDEVYRFYVYFLIFLTCLKYPRLIFFWLNFLSSRCVSIWWTFLTCFWKNPRKFFSISPTCHSCKNGSKIESSRIFRNNLEMFTMLKYIGEKENLAEKNYLGCFRQVRKIKKSA
jgi:hypothetical protein